MKILLTGNEGFFGRHAEPKLREAGHEVVGLEQASTFQGWQDTMQRVVTPEIEAVVHAGAMPANQSLDPKIYLWNAHATYLLAKKISGIQTSTHDYCNPIPFIFFSTFLVSSTQNDWEARTPYGWSKWCAESYVKQWLPNATILRPGVQWGDETGKPASMASIPYQLATHTLKHLFRHWGRSYVHVLDVCEAINVCLADRSVGTFELHTQYMNNQNMAKLVQWEGYEWVDNPEKTLGYITTEHAEVNVEPILPNWYPNIFLEEELPRMENGI